MSKYFKRLTTSEHKHTIHAMVQFVEAVQMPGCPETLAVIFERGKHKEQSKLFGLSPGTTSDIVHHLFVYESIFYRVDDVYQEKTC